MPRPSRRHLLQAVTATALGFPGCLSMTDSTQPSPATDSPLAIRDQLTVDGAVVARATSQHPLRIRYTITNEGSETLTLQSRNKAPLLWIRRLTGDAGAVVLVPPDSSEVFADALASSPIDGCWRFVTRSGDDAVIGVQTDTGEATIEPGGTYSVDHHAYYDGRDACFPPGTYSQTTTLDFGGVQSDGPLLNVHHAVRIASDGTPSVEVGQLEPCDSHRDCKATTSTPPDSDP